MEFLPQKRQSPMSLTSRPKRARWYSIKVEKEDEKEENAADGEQVLELKHFSRAPYLSFNKVKVGTSKRCSLLVKNPFSDPQEVSIDKFPYRKGFNVETTKFVVPPNQEVNLTVTWTPTEASDCREIVYFRTSTGCRTQAVLLGTAFKPPNKKKSQGRRILSPKNILEKPRKRSSVPETIKTSTSITNSLTNANNIFSKDDKENGFVFLSNKTEGFLPNDDDDYAEEKSVFTFNERNLKDTYNESPLRRQTILIKKMFPDPAPQEKTDPHKNYFEDRNGCASDESSRAQMIQCKSQENEFFSVEKGKPNAASVKVSNLGVFDTVGHDLRRATFVKSDANIINDSLELPSENSPLEDSLVSESEAAARRTTQVLPQPTAFVGSVNKVSHFDFIHHNSENTPLEDSLVLDKETATRRTTQVLSQPTSFPFPGAPLNKAVQFDFVHHSLSPLAENVPLEDSLISSHETARRATHVLSKPTMAAHQSWGNITLRNEIGESNPFFLESRGKETYVVDDGGHGDEACDFFLSQTPTETKKMQHPADKVSEHCNNTSELHLPSKQNKWKLNPGIVVPNVVNIADLDTSPFSSHIDVNRLSTGTIVVANPVLSEDMLPHHDCSPIKAAAEAVPATEETEFLDTGSQNLNEPHIAAKSVFDSGTECYGFSVDNHIPLSSNASDDVRRCSTSIKLKPPDLHFTSQFFSHEVTEASQDLKISVEKENTFSGVAKSNLFAKPKCSGPTYKPRNIAAGQSGAKVNRHPKSSGSGTFVKDDGTKQKKSKASVTFEIQSKSDTLIEKDSNQRKPEVTRSNISARRNEKPVPARRPSVPSSVKVRKAPKVAQRKLTLFSSNKTDVPRHPNPFAAKNMYYDERWMEKQELAFTCWLNFVLTPPDDLKPNTEAKVDAAKLWVESMKRTTPTRAPTKEDMSLKSYTAIRQMNRLRKASCMLYQSKSSVEVIKKLEIEVETGRLLIRKDRAMHADVGIKQKILGFLLCYNPLWLRIGLETVYGELLPLQSNSDVIGLSHFIIHRMLHNPDIAAKYAHPTVPHLFKPGYEDELKKFTLKKFLLLVFFLDNAKQKRLINHDPCLFCKDAEFKSSRDLLLIFSREYLSGEGDITRHLRYLGYSVGHQQMPLEEFDFAVTNIAVDLRCGLRLVRVLELLLQIWTLSATVRVPAISRLQKIHNNDIALKTLLTAGFKIEGDISSRDIVDGHREKTLSLLWQIIFQTQISKLLDKKKLEEEIKSLKSSLQFKADLAAIEAIRGRSENHCSVYNPFEASGLYTENEILGLLLQWCQVVCAYYYLKVSNFTVSFSDGRALCYLLHHYLPSVLPKASIKEKTTLSHFEETADQSKTTSDLDDSFENVWTLNCKQGKNDSVMNELLANEKENLLLAFEKFQEIGGIPIVSRPPDISNTIPDEKVIITQVAYMNYRLMDLTQEIRAARIIQIAWRKRYLKKEFKLLQRQIKAAITIQRAVRKFLQYRLFIRQQNAATVIQSAWRMYQAKKEAARLRHERWMKYLNCKATLIQAAYRGYRARHEMKKQQQAAVLIQSVFRQWRVRSLYVTLKTCAIKIQCRFRANVEAKLQHEKYLRIRKLVILIQSLARGWLARKHLFERHKAAILIQATFRSWRTRKLYNRKKTAAIKLQHWYRSTLLMRTCRQQYQNLKNSTVLIQACYRGYMCRKQHKLKVKSSVIIQAHVRLFLLKQRFEQLKKATTTIQRKWRAVLIGRKERKSFLLKRQSAITLQSVFRMLLAVSHFKRKKEAVITLQKFTRCMIERKKFKKNKESAVLIQTWWRSILLRNKDRSVFLELKQATIMIQSKVKMLKARKCYFKVKHAVKIIEEHYIRKRAMEKQRNVFLLQRKSAIVLQSAYRAHVCRKVLAHQRKAATTIQAAFRMHVARKLFLQKKMAARCIQRYYRSYVILKKENGDYHVMKKGFIRLQACFRGSRTRKEILKWHNSAVKIQSVFRGWKTRKCFKNLRNACICVQRNYRGRMLMKKEVASYKKTRQSVIVVQSLIRGFLARKRYQRIKASIVIQASIRQYLARKSYVKLKLACIKIQACVRMHIQRKSYQKLREAAVVLQRYYHKEKEMQFQRTEFLQKRKSVTVLQAHFRRMAEQKSFHRKKKAVIIMQSFFRMVKQRKAYQQQRRASLLIQQKFRAYQLARCERRSFLKIRSACIKIQAFCRMLKAKNKYRELRSAVLTIQARYRALCLSREQRRSYLSCRSKIIALQSVIRGTMARRKYLRIIRSAILIQTCFRKYSAQKQYRDLQKATLCLQKYVRQWIISRNIRQNYLLMKKSAVIIQSRVRGFLVREEVQRKRNACIIMQRQFRSVLARKQFVLLRYACIVLQVRYRALRTGREVRLQYSTMKKSAICIQSWWRSVMTRKSYTRKIRAAVIIQSHFRSLVIARTVHLEYTTMRKAAITMQAAWRGHKGRQQYKELRSAIRLQALFRMLLARRELIRKRQAAIRIQSCVKMYIAQKAYKKQRACVIFVQRLYRAKLEGRKARELYHNKRKACIIIQSWWKSILQRRVYLTQRTMILKIQAAFFAYSARKEFLNLKKSAVVIQKSWRGYQLTKKMRHQFLQRRAAAISIQHCYRKYIHRQHAAVVIQRTFRGYSLRNRYKKMKSSALKIQSWFRCITAQRNFLKMRQATIVLQRHVKAVLVGNKVRQEYISARADIMNIQAYARGFLARKKYHRHLSARKIQAWYRGNTQRRNFVKMCDAVCVLQKHARAYIVGRRVRQEFLLTRTRVIRIQACVRMFLAKKEYQRNVKATKIQSWYRGAVQRRKFLKVCQAACTLQEHIRAFILRNCVRNQYLEDRRNIIKVQACTRRFLAKKQYQKHLHARKIQTWYRTCLQRKRFCLMKERVTLIQAAYRGYLVRRDYVNLRKSSIVIQRKWRSILQARKVEQRKNSAAVMIQRGYRCYLQRKRCIQNLHLVLKLQSHIRGFLIRKKILDQKLTQAAVLIQAHFRGYLARKTLQRIKELQQRKMQFLSTMTKKYLSAVCIQRCYRQYCLRKFAKQHLPSVILIQFQKTVLLSLFSSHKGMKMPCDLLRFFESYKAERWYRACLQRRWYLRFRSSVVAFQRAALCYISKQSNAACIIQLHVRSWLARKQFVKIRKASVTIQAVWRGYKVRSQNKNPLIVAARKRIQQAASNASEEMILGNLVHKGLDFLLKYRNLSHLLTALRHLDTTTRLSATCCEKFVEAQGSLVLIKLMGSCNRSLPHMELIKYSTNILLNVAKYDKTVDSVWNSEGSIETILELMSIFREKGTLIFTKCCSLLWIMCQDPVKAKVIKANSCLSEKICSLHYLLTRKQKIEEQRLALKFRMAQNLSTSFLSTSVSFISRPKERVQIQPDWMLGKHVMREFEDPIVAITSVMNTLCLKKKEFQQDSKRNPPPARRTK